MTFLTMGSKYYNTDDRSVWNTRGTTLKNKPHLITFHESILVSLWTFQPTLAKELTVATHVMKTSSIELSTSVSDSVKCKQTEINAYT